MRGGRLKPGQKRRQRPQASSRRPRGRAPAARPRELCAHCALVMRQLCALCTLIMSLIYEHCNFKVGVFDRKVLSCRYSHGGLPRPPSMTAQATALRPRQTQGDSVFVDTMIKREAIPREFTPHLISPSARAACARGGRVAPISSRVPSRLISRGGIDILSKGLPHGKVV